MSSSTGTIYSGVGLISGINTAQLIEQLIAIDARPKTILQNRVTVLNSQATALQEINAKLLALKGAVSTLVSPNLFKTTTAASSDSTVLTASTRSTATPGTYTFQVSRLVSTQQCISRGFSDADTTPVGSGTITIESGSARLERDTLLSELRGGAGVSRGKIRITDRSGNSAVVDLSTAVSVNDVLTAINTASGISVQASVEGDSLKITDLSGGSGTLKVENVGATATADSLGLTTDLDSDPSTITGARINYLSTSTLISALNDGNGITRSPTGADLVFTAGSLSFTVSLSSARTLGDIITAINSHQNNTFVTASLNSDATGLLIQYSGTDPLTISGASAASLGIQTTGATGDVTGSRLIATINSRLIRNLRGGAGVTLGTISITNRAGQTTLVDLSSATSVADVIRLINSANAGVTASLNSAGHGLRITDTTGSTVSNLVITGQGAAELGLEVNDAVSSKDSGNLQLRYISEGTYLSSLNGGRGVALGKFVIRDSSGNTATIDLTTGNVLTVGDVLTRINASGLALTARINDNGDGILLEDKGLGAVTIKVSESGSTTAADLGLLGEAAAAGEDLDGSFEKTITLDGTETLQALADKISAAGYGVRAVVVNDGSAISPYRLSLTASRSGRAGAFIFDDGGLNLGITTLTEARDAVVFFGSPDPATALAIVSPTNTLTNTVTGATIDLKGTSSRPVELIISRDDQAIISAVQKMVDAFNEVITAINKHDSYNSETKERGLLLGDATVARARSALFNIINGTNTDLTGRYNSLAQIGITVGSDAKLKFDADKFRQALATDRSAVEALFTMKVVKKDESGNVVRDSRGQPVLTSAGIGARLEQVLIALTDSVDGVFKVRTDAISKEVEVTNDRIKAMEKLLEVKKQRLQTQFNAMEKALSTLQAQNSALTSLSLLAIQAYS